VEVGRSMDQLDIRILRELNQAYTVWPGRPGLFSSYREIAQKLRVSPGTVRNRIREMARTGFLNGTSVYPNPTLLGLESGSHAIEIGAGVRKEDVLRRLGALPGVVFLENLRGNLLGIGFVYEPSTNLRALLDRFERVAHAAPGMFSHVRQPTPSSGLTLAEWRLVSRLMSGTVRSYLQLAHELQVSTRTLKRRIRRLTGSGAMFTFPLLELRALSGGVTTELLISYSPESPEVRTRALQRLDDWLIFAGVWDEFDIYRLILPNVTLAGDLAKEVAGWDGVRFARVELVEGLINQLTALRPYVLREIAALEAKAKRTVTP